jgi:hypothetical protein
MGRGRERERENGGARGVKTMTSVGLTLGRTEPEGLTQPDEADWAGLMGQFGQVYLGHCPINH